MPSTGYRAPKPPDASSEKLNIDRTDQSVDPRTPQDRPIEPSTASVPHPVPSRVRVPQLWTELLPLGVQYRIAEYVCEGVSGRDALRLAQVSPHHKQVVSVALHHFLIDNFATHAEELVDKWVAVSEDVRVLELWEHPPNFRLLHAPALTEVILEDEPNQIQALAESSVSVRRIEFYARYGTPCHIVVSMFESVRFTELEFDDIKGAFFEHVDVEQFAKSCDGLEDLVVSTARSNQDAVADFVQRLTSLRVVRLVIEGVEISFSGRLPGRHCFPNVIGMGLYLCKVKWFESFDLPSQLKELWLMSDQGWGKNEVLQFSCVILQLPNLEELTVRLLRGSECFFPKVSSLLKFHAYWIGEVEVSDTTELYYKPQEGVVTSMIEGMPLLIDLRLAGVRLTDEEVVQVVKTVGDTVETFGVSVDRQDKSTLERLLVVIQALAKYTKRLEDFSLCQRNEQGIPIYDPCGELVTVQRKHEMLLHLDHLHLHAPNVQLGHVEISILDWPEEEPDSQKAGKEKEEALQKTFMLRRCRRGMNESGDPVHMCMLAKLLETGCDDLAQDRDMAVDLYKRAIWMGDPGDALLNLWRLTEDPKDKSTEPRRGGAFETVLDLDKSRMKRLPIVAEIFLKGTDSTEANPAAAEKLLQLAVDRGLVHNCSLKLGNLVRAGYDDVPPDPYRAFDLYQLAIDEHDDPDAMFSIAELLKHGYGSEPRNPIAALAYLKRGVRLGWAPCMNDLGVILEEGYDDVPPDADAAAELYKQAIADGNTVAMSNLASLYVNSCLGNAAMTQKAIELYERSISEGQNPHAMLMLGLVHERGYEGVSPNPQRAKELYIQAIEWGEYSAYTYLGNLLTDGYDDVPPDPDEAIRLYQLAVDTGDKRARAVALCAHARLMDRGVAHIKPDPVKAIELYRRSIDEGEVPSFCLLADLLEEGRPGIEPNLTEVCALLNRAVEEARDTDAMRKLGELLECGRGEVKADPYKAVELYKRAINAGDTVAYAFLGDTLEQGYGDEPPDHEAAVVMYKKGVDCGDPEAMCCLGALLERGYGNVNPDPAAATDLYRRAIDTRNYSKAMRFLGMSLADGYVDTPPDKEAAMALYERAAETDPWSKVLIARIIEDGYGDMEPDLGRARNLYKEVIDDARRSPDRASVAMRGVGRVTEKIAEDDAKQLDEAAYWYRLAIDTREGPCCLYDLAVLVGKGYGDVEPDIPQTVSLLRRATEYNLCSRPFFLLADHVREGYGDVQPDPTEAESLEEDGCSILWNSMHINRWH